MKNFFRKIALPLVVLVVGYLLMQGMALREQPDATNERQFAQQVNLAMRQAADRLLDLAGDTTSTIPPVEWSAATGEYLLRLENNFSYDSLPGFLEAALAQYGIHEKYYVTINDCLDNLLMLGYSKETLKDGEPACMGRAQKAGCYNLSLVFLDQAKKAGGNGWTWAGLLLLSLLAFTATYFYKKRETKPMQATQPLSEAPNASLVRFGNTSFDLANQYVQIGDQRQPLTFREAKLLHFFLQNQNQVLERDAILAAVWEDEGIIVGRSLDVFVSRLRKILQKDSTVKITNVHGVGYRLEVA